jgi:serine/threonine protein kinase
MISQVGRYRITRQLGKGDLGVVYLADDPRLRRRVAIKALELPGDDQQRRERFRAHLTRSAEAAALLSHPNIAAVYDMVDDDLTAYVVMEYVAGESLSARLRRIPEPDFAFTRRVLREVAAALDHAHASGVVHGAIKPNNIMIDVTGVPKITDFGISATAQAEGLTACATPYIAPEQLKGESADARADQFALGAVAFEMLTGSPLPTSNSRSARNLNHSLPRGIDSVLARALSPNPRDRFAYASEFIATLDALFPTAAPPPPAPRSETGLVLITPPPPQRGRPMLPIILILATLAALGIASLLWMPQAPPSWMTSHKPAESSAAPQAPK